MKNNTYLLVGVALLLIGVGILVAPDVVVSPTVSPSSVVDNQQPASQEATTQGVVVTNQIIKQEQTGCAYYFDIRNNSSTPFSGEVMISLLVTGSEIIQETFDTGGDPLASGEGLSAHIDIVDCSPRADQFRYRISLPEGVIDSATGSISEKVYK